jgi:Domain of unknown function (DUF4262)
MTERLTEYEEKILSNVREYGCHVTTVFDPDGDEPNFAYSAGFTLSVCQPEVIVFGLDPILMGSMINSALDQCKLGANLADFARISGLLEGFDIIVRTIPEFRIEREYLNSAMWFHEREFDAKLQRVVQLVWPSSTTGLFPWEEGCDDSVIEAQPALYEIGLNS